MAKRKKPAAPTIPTTRNVVEVSDGGIYPIEHIIGVEHGTMKQSEMSAMLVRISDHAARLTALIADARRRARIALEAEPTFRREPAGPPAMEAGRTYAAVDIGDGLAPCSYIEAELSERGKDALALLHALRAVEGFSPADTYKILEAFRAGALAERVFVRGFEPLALREKKREKGKTAAADRNRQRARALFEQLRLAEPLRPKGAIVRQIVRELNGRDRTIRSYLTGLK